MAGQRTKGLEKFKQSAAAYWGSKKAKLIMYRDHISRGKTIKWSIKYIAVDIALNVGCQGRRQWYS
jgi:hypothetical protein